MERIYKVFDVQKSGRGLIAMAKDVLDVYDISLEDVQIKVHLN